MIRDPDVSLISRLRGQGGFALTEVIAAAAVLAILALGVLAGLDGAASSSGREKARSVAASLAEEDQERLHSIPAVNLPELRETKNVTVGNIEYTVESEADWISDANGATVSCTSEGGKADYLRLRTTVKSSTVGSRTPPVRLESLVAPPVGSAGGNNGTLAVQVLNRDKVGVQSITVGIKGQTANHTASKPTNAVGCAIFGNIPGDTYAVTVNVPEWVDPRGITAVSTTGTVTPGATTITPIDYDIRAQVTTAFDTRFYNYKNGAWETRASRAWALSLSNPGVPGSGLRTFEDKSGDVDPLSVHTAELLFPFATGYGIFAGRCAEQNPGYTPALQPWAAEHAFQESERDTLYDRRTSPARPIRMPALALRIYRGSTPAPYGNANVVAKLVTAPPGPEVAPCSDILGSHRDDGSWGLTSYSGSAWSGTNNGMTGFVTKVRRTDTEFDPGLPFGRWQVCADDYNGSNNSSARRNFITIDNLTPDGEVGTDGKWKYQTLNITAGGLGRCSQAGWPAP